MIPGFVFRIISLPVTLSKTLTDQLQFDISNKRLRSVNPEREMSRSEDERGNIHHQFCLEYGAHVILAWLVVLSRFVLELFQKNRSSLTNARFSDRIFSERSEIMLTLY